MSNHKKITRKTYESIGEIIIDLSLMLSPPEDLTVSQSAAKYRKLNNAGSYVGDWQNSKTWYMVEPGDLFTSYEYNGLVFVGSAQSGKTDMLVLNTVAHTVKVDPMDMILYCPGMTETRDFSLRRMDRLHLHSPDIGEMLLPSKNADNVFDKRYTTGMLFTMTWPSRSSVAGKPIPRVVITDRDRMDDSIEGDGEVFDLVQKRTETFGIYAMTVCESSPSRPITDPRWFPSTPHEAPPCEGILKLYNRGDRRRWYWPCLSCGEYFEGKFEHLTWDTKLKGTNKEISETVRMKCPHCSYLIPPDDRDEMQFFGHWLKDGQGITNLKEGGEIFGPSIRTSTASFWLRGVAAAFTKWSALVDKYLTAMEEYRFTGSESSLIKFYNNDLGEPYIPQRQSEIRVPAVLMSRAEDGLTLGKVPQGVRFLIATIDVQKHRFVVQVFGILPGANKGQFDSIVIDRFDIEMRIDEETAQPYAIKPAIYLKDWNEITTRVLQAEYELDDDSGRKMSIRLTACDSGGEAGATSNAYAYWRSLREQNLQGNFVLLKGENLPNRPRTEVRFPDANKRDNKNAARGDVPVLFLNSNNLKDLLDGRLDCMEPGHGMYRTIKGLSHSFYNELCVEVRDPIKGWINEFNYRNESWDLSYYMLGLCISSYIRIEVIDWVSPPTWAAPWDFNTLVRTPVQEKPFQNTIKSVDFGKYAEALA